MDSSVRRMKRRNLTPTRRIAAGLVVAMAGTLMVGCQALETGLEPHDQLNCEPEALPGTFRQQSEGVFTIDDLASRTDEPGERKAGWASPEAP